MAMKFLVSHIFMLFHSPKVTLHQHMGNSEYNSAVSFQKETCYTFFKESFLHKSSLFSSVLSFELLSLRKFSLEIGYFKQPKGGKIHIIEIEIHITEIALRYYATFKVRKFESLFYKFNICLQKKLPLALDRRQRKYII